MRLASSTNDEPRKRCEETDAAKTELSTAARNDSESERRKGITGGAADDKLYLKRNKLVLLCFWQICFFGFFSI